MDVIGFNVKNIAQDFQCLDDGELAPAAHVDHMYAYANSLDLIRKYGA